MPLSLPNTPSRRKNALQSIVWMLSIFAYIGITFSIDRGLGFYLLGEVGHTPLFPPPAPDAARFLFWVGLGIIAMATMPQQMFARYFKGRQRTAWFVISRAIFMVALVFAIMHLEALLLQPARPGAGSPAHTPAQSTTPGQ